MSDSTPATAALEAYASIEADKHKPEQGGGCTCGFCMWSIEHVVVMSIRDGWKDGQVAVDWSDLHWLIAMAEPNVPDGHWRLDRLRSALGWAGRIQE